MRYLFSLLEKYMLFAREAICPIQQSIPRPAWGRPKLLDRERDAIRRKHYRLRTEDSYAHWVKRFIHFHGKRPPRELADSEITPFCGRGRAALRARSCAPAHR